MLVVSCGEIPSAPKIPDEALLAPAQSQQSLVLTPATATILVGQSLTLTVTNANGSALNKKATWTSSDTSIAIVISTGISTATVTGRRSGTVTITAANGQKTGSNSTTVVPVPVRSVTLAPDSARVQLGDEVQYVATPTDSAGNPLTGRAVTWSVTNASIATVDSNGLATTHARGSTQVIATIEGVADTTWLTVEQTPSRIELAEKSIIFDALGETRQLIANVYDSRNNLIPDAAVSWASSDSLIATVDTGGSVTPRATGSYAWTFVEARLGALADSAVVTVYRNPTSIIASPDSMVITELTPEGETSGQITAVMYDRNGYPITEGWIIWESLDPSVATVTMDGGVAALADGLARLVAISFSGVSDTVLVTVATQSAEGAIEWPRLVSDASAPSVPEESGDLRSASLSTVRVSRSRIR